MVRRVYEILRRVRTHLSRARATETFRSPESTRDGDRRLTYAIVRARKAHGEAGKPSGERYLVVRFDQQVDVIRLYREVHDPKPRARGLAESAAGRHPARRAETVQ